MYKFINENQIVPFKGDYIKDEVTDTMYVHPSNETLSRFGYMEIERPSIPEIEDNQYIDETYAVADGKIHVSYSVLDIEEVPL